MLRSPGGVHLETTPEHRDNPAAQVDELSQLRRLPPPSNTPTTPPTKFPKKLSMNAAPWFVTFCIWTGLDGFTCVLSEQNKTS